MRKHIPNTITLLNVLCGVLAIPYALQANVEMTTMYLAFSLVFDFADGLAARLLKAYSDLGKQLDSLADLVSFGVVPALLASSVAGGFLEGHYFSNYSELLKMIPLVLVLAAALRLAKFNIDDSQEKSFKGLPVPANALFILSLSYMLQTDSSGINFSEIVSFVILLSGSILSAWTMISDIPLFSLKLSGFSWKENQIRYTFLLACIPVLYIFRWSGFTLIIWGYVMLGLGLKLANKEGLVI